MSSHLTRLCLALSAVALTGATLATPAVGRSAEARSLQGTPCNEPTPQPTQPTAASVRIGTFNIRAGESTRDFAAGVRALAPHVDIAGLQEVNSKNKARAMTRMTGTWGFYRQFRQYIPSHPRQGGAEQQPIMWRRSRFACTSAGPVLMSRPYDLRREKPAIDDRKNWWFTVVHLVD